MNSRSVILLATVLAAALSSATALAQGAAHVPARASAAPAVEAVNGHYAALVHASYSDTLAGARELRSVIEAFLLAPSAHGLEAARRAWVAARELYGQTEAYRFYGGPIDSDDGPEGRINAWPLDEVYIDYVEGRADAGFINDSRFVISKASLADVNERDGEENVSTGWHAIEFLLWGQDLSETGPGQRSWEDYVDGKRPNADRRRQYLRAVTGLLVDDLSALVQAWAPGRKNYRAEFQRGGRESLRKIIVGLGSLSRGELAGERMEVALNSQDQEDEHSCFSDNTHRDIVSNALGIQNVWLGQYRRRDGSLLQGPSLRSLVAARDAALAERTTAQLARSVALAETIQAPFDREVIGGREAPGRARIQATVDSLVEQSRLLVSAAGAVGITRLNLAQP